ncbi:MAG: HAD family phosphatase [Lachnospiraceae bacterium]|nr:HAD family phosphatase [Lachnospiraceae bacterium]
MTEYILDKINPIIQGKKALIFDVDGTLLDSMPMWARLDIDYLEGMGYHPEPDFCTRVKMMTISDASVYIKEYFGVDKELETITEEIMELARVHYEKDLLLKPGAADLIIRLKELGYHLVVATANEYDMVQKCLERNGIMEYMDGLVTCTMVGASKQKPDVYLKACELAGASVEEAVIFEDSNFAINTAINAGFDVIGVYDDTEKDKWDIICDMTKEQVVF